MKFNVIFLKKKHFFYILVLLILIIFLIVFFTKENTRETFSVMSQNITKRTDLTGDGKEDILYINIQDNKYNMQVNTGNKSFALEPNRKLNTLGTYCEYWPMRITFKDISRDKIPEIFIQSSSDSNAVQHIFYWDSNGSKFKDAFYSSNNLIGFIDSNNNKTPKFISGNYKFSKIIFENYIFLNDKFEKFNFDPSICNSDSFLGKNTIIKLINYVENLPKEDEKINSIFSPEASGKDISILGKLASENNKYYFQDGIFMDKKWSKENNILKINWILNFKGISKTNSNNLSNCTLNIILTVNSSNDETYPYKISSIILK